MALGLITDIEERLVGDWELCVDGLDTALLSDPTAGPALRAFLSLSQCHEQFLGAGWSPETIFWSRYFWFRRFLSLWSREHGFDAGLEQQALRILENPFPGCTPDWSRLSEVEGEANAI